jgi:hypothetical protein
VLVKADSHRLGRRLRRGQLVRAERLCLIPQRLVKLMGGPEGLLLSLADRLRDVLQHALTEGEEGFVAIHVD